MSCPYAFLTMPTLYLVPTPLGDPDDITLRALRILREVKAIIGFTYQSTEALLDHYSITATPIISDEHVFQALDIGDVALIAAGTPAIKDWSHKIVVEAIARGIRVEALHGASAEITALVLSGLPTEAFVYVGALPSDLSAYTHERETMIFDVNDVTEPVGRLLEAFGDRRICITRLAPSEWIYRGTLADAIQYDRTQPGKDGIMLVVEGAAEEIAEIWDETRVELALRERLQAGDPLKQAAKEIAAAAGWDRRAVYALGVEIKKIL